MAVEMSSRAPETPFAPLPLRARGALELLDTSIKLYRQYFGPLFGWSLLIQACVLVGGLVAGGWLASILLSPILVGASVCCLAAAVRGQRVTFKQCWEFTKPRYGALVGISLLAELIIGAIVVGFALVFGIAAAVGYSASSGVGIVLIGLIGLVLLGFAPYAIVWGGLVPTVICFEDDKRNTSALKRAYDLPRGHWNRIVGLIAVLGLASLAVVAIFLVTAFLLKGGGKLTDMVSGGGISSELVQLMLGFSLLSGLFQALITPLSHLCIGLFYLDTRVRKEALDLEWAAHASAPAAPPSSSLQGAPGFINGQNPHYAPQQYAPQNYAPQPFASQQYAPQNPAPPQPFNPQAAAPLSAQAAASQPINAAPAVDITRELGAPGSPFSPAPSAAAPQAMAQPFVPPLAPSEAAPQVQAGATVACRECGAVSPHGQRFCMTCGAQLPAS